MADYRKNDTEENTFIKAYEDVERSKTPIRGPEAFPLLEIVQGPKQGTWFTVAYQKEITLGRAATNSIILEDNSVSRSHAVLQSDGDNYTIRDIGSRNGTFLNEKKIQGEVPLNHLDQIKIGIYTFRFLQEPTEEEYEHKEERTPVVEPETSLPMETVEPGVEQVGEEVEAEELPAVPAEAQAPEEAEPPPPKPTEEKPEHTIQEDLEGIVSKGEELPPAPSEKPASRPLKSLGILILVIGVLGVGGYVAYSLGAFDKLKTYLGTSKTSKPTTKQGKQPKTLKPKKPEAPEGEVIPIFLEVDAEPIPAKVFYKGKELGVTPFKISVQVPAGKPQELSGEVFLESINEKFTEKRNFEVKKQDELVDIKFQPKLGSLNIKALPKEGEIYLEGHLGEAGGKTKSIKLSDVNFNEPIFLPYGKYVAEIRVPEKLAGSESLVNSIKYRREFELSESTSQMEINAPDQALKTFPAKITSDPAGAELMVDGKKVGETPFDGLLPTGRNKLVLRKEGFDDLEKELTIEMNTPYEANFNLVTSPAGEFINEGRALLKKGLYNESIEKLAEALKRKPESTELNQIHMLLGEAFNQSKTYDQALAYYQKAEADPAYAKQAKLGMAEAYAGMGQNSQALIQIIDVYINTKDKKIRSQAEGVYQRISPMKSVLYVATQPAGAQITVNGNPINQDTPVILSDLLVGSYRVGIQKVGFKPYETRVTLPMSSIKPVIVNLEPEP